MGGAGATMSRSHATSAKHGAQYAEDAIQQAAVRETRARRRAVAQGHKSKADPRQGSRHAPIDLTDDYDCQGSTGSKRKATSRPPPSSSKSKVKPSPACQIPSDPPARKKRKKDEEKRQGRFRAQPPQAFYDIYERATSQRFFVLSRTRTGTEEFPGELVELTGSTGNIYTVHIGQRPSCDCPHAGKGNQCKHILFVMKKVLNAPFNLIYQLGLLSTELQDIFAGAPPIEAPESEQEKQSDKRKPIEGDCPICFSELEEKGEAIVWCQAACGQNIHKQCFETWARTKGGGDKVTCPMCRSQWQGPDIRGIGTIRRDKGIRSEGYLNVASQLGISQQRDHSSYSEWFNRPHYGGGWSREAKAGAIIGSPP